MGKKYKKSYVSLDTLRNEKAFFSIIISCIEYAISDTSIDSNQLEDTILKLLNYKQLTDISPKLDLNFKEKQLKNNALVNRDYNNDRKYKLDTIKINTFSQEHNKEIDEATVHIGMYADEYARLFNALALTVGKDIYFRNGAYKPETEEGRKLLAHELTHVSQNKNKEDYRNIEKEKLENEAIYEEKAEEYETDPIVDYKAAGKTFRIRKSLVKKIEQESNRMVENWVEQQEGKIPDEDFFKLLSIYEKFEEAEKWN